MQQVYMPKDSSYVILPISIPSSFLSIHENDMETQNIRATV